MQSQCCSLLARGCTLTFLRSLLRKYLINDFLSFCSLVYFYIIVPLEHPLRHVSRVLSAARAKERFVHARHSKNHRATWWSTTEEIRESLSTCWTTHRHVCSSLLSGRTVLSLSLSLCLSPSLSPSIPLFFSHVNRPTEIYPKSVVRPKLGVSRYLPAHPRR